MSEHTLFHIVFLSQILLISAYFPRKILGRMKYVFETYPPSTYPKLYPVPVNVVEKGLRTYRIMNLPILLILYVRSPFCATNCAQGMGYLRFASLPTTWTSTTRRWRKPTVCWSAIRSSGPEVIAVRSFTRKPRSTALSI